MGGFLTSQTVISIQDNKCHTLLLLHGATGSVISKVNKVFTPACVNNQEVPQQKAASLLHLIDIHLNNSVI